MLYSLSFTLQERSRDYGQRDPVSVEGGRCALRSRALFERFEVSKDGKKKKGQTFSGRAGQVQSRHRRSDFTQSRPLISL